MSTQPMSITARLCVAVVLTTALLAWLPSLHGSCDTHSPSGSQLESFPPNQRLCSSPFLIDVTSLSFFDFSHVKTTPKHAPSRLMALLPSVLLEAEAARNFTVCSFASNADLTTVGLTAKHAVFFYGDPSGGGYGRFPPDINFKFRLLGDGTLSRSNYALSFALATHAAQATGIACDALSGPGYSYLSIAMSPVVGSDVVWVDPYSSSTALSSTVDHPTFNRIVATDDFGAKMIATVMKEFGWNDANLLCLDEAYGRSLFQSLNDAIVANNGTVHIAKCLLNDATSDEMKAALVNIRDNSRSKFVFLGMIIGDPFDRMMKTIIDNRFDEEMIFFFAGVACGNVDRAYGAVKSGLCIAYSSNDTLLAPFYQSYQSRNYTEDEEQLKATGWTKPAGYNYTAESLVVALAHDSTTHAMASLAGKTSSQTAVQAVRSTVTVGATGRVAMDANGNRISIDVVVYNAQGEKGKHRPIAYIREGKVYFSDNTGSQNVIQATPPEMLLLGKRSSIVPLVAVPTVPPVPVEADNTLFIAACTALVAVLVAVGGGVAAYYIVTTVRRRTALARCPSDPAKPFSAFFISIKNEAVLRDEFSAESAETVCRKVEHMVDECAAKYSCHVAKKLDAHFLVLSICPRKALQCIGEVLKKVERYEWEKHAPSKQAAAVVGSAVQTARDSAQSSNQTSRSSRQQSPGRRRGPSHVSQGTDTPLSVLSVDEQQQRNSVTRKHSLVRKRSRRTCTANPRKSKQGLDMVLFCPRVSVGCSYCFGTIAALSEAECRVGEMPWRWGGAPIDQAASLADYALGDQVLCTEGVQEAVEDEDAGTTAAGIGAFEEFCRRVLPGAKKPTAVFQFDVDGLAPRDYTGRSECSSIDAGQGGGVLAALEADAGGVNTRKVAMVALYCTAFNKKDTLNAAVDQALVAASAAATPLKGKIAAVVDSAMYITVNATGPTVSQAPSRAAAIAAECVGVLSDVTGGAVYAGIEYGPCAVGTAPGVDKELGLGTPGYVLTNSALPQNALMLAKIAEGGPCPVVAGQSAYTDLEVGYLLRAVDIVGYAPRVKKPSSETAVEDFNSSRGAVPEAKEKDQAPSPVLADLPLPHSIVSVLKMAHGVLDKSSAGAEDDEWMYQLTDAESGNPFKLSNRAMTAILKGKGPNAQDASDTVDFAAVEDGVVTALLEAIEHCSGETFAEQLQVYAVQRVNRATATFPIVGVYPPALIVPRHS